MYVVGATAQRHLLTSSGCSPCPARCVTSVAADPICRGGPRTGNLAVVAISECRGLPATLHPDLSSMWQHVSVRFLNVTKCLAE